MFYEAIKEGLSPSSRRGSVSVQNEHEAKAGALLLVVTGKLAPGITYCQKEGNFFRLATAKFEMPPCTQ